MDAGFCQMLFFCVYLYDHMILKGCFYYLLLFRERGKEREGEKQQCVVASHVPPSGDLAHTPGMCPDRISNQGPFGLQAGTQSTETHQPGLNSCLYQLPYGETHFIIRHFT